MKRALFIMYVSNNSMIVVIVIGPLKQLSDIKHMPEELERHTKDLDR